MKPAQAGKRDARAGCHARIPRALVLAIAVVIVFTVNKIISIVVVCYHY